MVVIAVCTGCVKSDVTPVREGVFVVTAEGMALASTTRTQDEANKLAAGACPKGYTILERASPKSGAKIVETIECYTSTVADAPRLQPAPPLIFPRREATGTELAATPAQSWSCTHVVNTNFGSCARSLQECEGRRRYMSVSGKMMTDCLGQAAAFCFDLRPAPGDELQETCSPNPAGCSDRLDYEVETRGPAAAASACEPR